MNKNGFTLVELMIVLAILGVLAGIGIPQYMAVLERSRVGADRATIATVQSALNAFIAEAGGIDEITVGDAATPGGGGQADEPKAIKGTSIITGQSITFDMFWDDGNDWPELQSEFDDGDWEIDSDGMIYVVLVSGTDEEYLPDYR